MYSGVCTWTLQDPVATGWYDADGTDSKGRILLNSAVRIILPKKNEQPQDNAK